MEIRPLDFILLHKEALDLALCCDCYYRECDTCPANETKGKFKRLVRKISESKNGGKNGTVNKKA